MRRLRCPSTCRCRCPSSGRCRRPPRGASAGPGASTSGGTSATAASTRVATSSSRSARRLRRSSWSRTTTRAAPGGRVPLRALRHPRRRRPSGRCCGLRHTRPGRRFAARTALARALRRGPRSSAGSCSRTPVQGTPSRGSWLAASSSSGRPGSVVSCRSPTRCCDGPVTVASWPWVTWARSTGRQTRRKPAAARPAPSPASGRHRAQRQVGVEGSSAGARPGVRRAAADRPGAPALRAGQDPVGGYATRSSTSERRCSGTVARTGTSSA